MPRSSPTASSDREDPVPAVSWESIHSEAEFYDCVLPQCGSPSWHGRNLDALNDSWVTGGIDTQGPPYDFAFEKGEAVSPELAWLREAVQGIARNSVAANGGSYRDSLHPHILSIAGAYWASFFNCPTAGLFASPCRIDFHGPELEGYWGASALFRDGTAMISIPRESEALLGDALSDPALLSSPAGFAAALAPVAAVTLGPAYVGYASVIADPGQSARSLEPSDSTALLRLEIECEPAEWEHGGSPIENPCSGVFIDGQLASLAGYEIWGGTIAHISIVTHPAFRGRGYARNAVAHLATRALAASLLPQYRTLESNHPSLRVAERLGFSHYSTSMAVRFSPDGVRPSSSIK